MLKLGRRKLLLIAILVEGALLVVSLIWADLRGFVFDLYPNGSEITWGLLSTLPLLGLNLILFGPVGHRFRFLDSFRKFKEEFVVPLAAELDFISAIIVSIAAGLGEEFFFRGFLQFELGLVTASFLFAFLHFGKGVRRFPLLASTYFLIGLYFGWLREATSSLWLVVIGHATYDLLILLYLRYVDLPRTGGRYSVAV